MSIVFFKCLCHFARMEDSWPHFSTAFANKAKQWQRITPHKSLVWWNKMVQWSISLNILRLGYDRKIFYTLPAYHFHPCFKVFQWHQWEREREREREVNYIWGRKMNIFGWFEYMQRSGQKIRWSSSCIVPAKDFI